MRSRILFQKLYVAIVLLVLLTIQVAIPVANASTPIDGSVRSFGFNNRTEVTNVVIRNSGSLALITSGTDSAGLERPSNFVIEFDVFDLDGFDHLDIYVALFNNDKSVAERSSGVLISAINSGVEDRGFVFRWMAPERSIYLSGLTSGISETFAFDIESGVSNFFVKSGISPINSGTYNSGLIDFVTPTAFNLDSSVTWEVTSGVTPSATVVQSGVVNFFEPTSSGVRNIKYRVSIPFVMSKVAPSSGVWNVGVMVHDRLQQEIDESRTNILEDQYIFTAEHYVNQWYGEVVIEGNSGLSFTNVQAGSGFQVSDQSGVTSGIQVRFISNGEYNQQVQSNTTWRPIQTIPTRPAFAYLVFSSGLSNPTTPDLDLLNAEGNRFVLQAQRVQLGGTPQDTGFVNIDPADPAGVVNFVFPVTSGTYQQHNNQIPSGVVVSSRISPISFAAGTTEIGVVSIFEFQIRLSAVFQNTQYNGNVSIGVSNKSTANEFYTPPGQ